MQPLVVSLNRGVRDEVPLKKRMCVCVCVCVGRGGGISDDL